MGRSRTAGQIVAALEKRSRYASIRRTNPINGEVIPEFEVIIVENTHR